MNATRTCGLVVESSVDVVFCSVVDGDGCDGAVVVVVVVVAVRGVVVVGVVVGGVCGGVERSTIVGSLGRRSARVESLIGGVVCLTSTRIWQPVRDT